MSFKIDMTMMYAVHDALRRELERIARVTARIDDDPRHLLGPAVGWEMFKRYLHAHHTAEDELVWPVMERLLAGPPDDLALLAAMESEHAAIDGLLGAVDAAIADRDSGPQRLGDLVDALVTGLSGHLRHEESEALPLIDATFTEQQWQRLGQRQAELIGADAPRYLPWLLDDMDPARIAAVLSRIPEPLRVAYRDEWRANYADLRLWPPARAWPWRRP
jgi:iron-sulfur cluster repair protein YtfE (RIC family)